MLKPMRHLASLSAMAARACVEAGLWELPPDSEDEEDEPEYVDKARSALCFAKMAYDRRQAGQPGGVPPELQPVHNALTEAAASAKKRQINVVVHQCEYMELSSKRRLVVEFVGPPEPNITDVAVMALADLFVEQPAAPSREERERERESVSMRERTLWRENRPEG